jgi:CRP-like cAMP-binding protein
VAVVDRTSLESFRRSLGNCVLLREIVAVDKDALLSRARLRRFGAGETIFLMGSPGDSMMAVLNGNVRISVPAVDGREIVGGHNFDFDTDVCTRCGIDRRQYRNGGNPECAPRHMVRTSTTSTWQIPC